MWVIGVKGSRCCAVIDFVEQVGEEVGSVVLALGGGVVVLGLEGGSEIDAGLEDRAGFADRLEGAVELGWAGAVAVAEEAVVFAADLGHLGNEERRTAPRTLPCNSSSTTSAKSSP